MRWLVLLFVSVLAQSCPVWAQDIATQDDASARSVWRSSASGEDGYFQKLDATQWIETTAATQLQFEEVARTDRYVELFDRSRALSLRLYADRAGWRQGSQWKRLRTGNWIAFGALPTAQASDYRIRLVYFVPADRVPAADYEQRIRVLMHFVSEVYRQDYESRNIKSSGLRFESQDGQPAVHLVRGGRPAAFYNGAPNYEREVQNHRNRVFAEIPASIGVPSRNLIVVFAETYDSGPHRVEWPGGIALGGRKSADGGTAIFSAWILRPEFSASTIERQRELLFDATPIKGRTALGHGRADSPRFEFIEDGFGAVAHEIGHALGLPHDKRDDQTYIMGNGFRNLRWNFMQTLDSKRRVRFSDDNARILYSSRYLAPDAVLSDRIPPTVRLSWVEPMRTDAMSVTVSVAASDNEWLRAILFFSPAQASVVGGRGLEGKLQNFEERIAVHSLKRGPFHLRALVTDAGGNMSQVELEGVVGE